MMDARRALDSIKQAVYRGRYFLAPHAQKRMRERNISFHEIRSAVMKATACQAYQDPTRQTDVDVSSWRVSGVDFEGEQLDVGVDLKVDHLGGFVVVITVF